MANQDALATALEYLKLETLLSLLPGTGDEHMEAMKKFCRILVSNGCPLDALMAGLKELAESEDKKHGA